METKKVKQKNQETDGCERDKRPEIEKIPKNKEVTTTETRKNWNEEKTVMQTTRYQWNQSEQVPDVYGGG